MKKKNRSRKSRDTVPLKHKFCCVRWSMGQIILPTPLSTNSSSSPTTDDIQKLLHFNAAQLANTSRNSAAARCHQLFNDAVSSSSEMNQPRLLLDSMDCFQAGLQKNGFFKKNPAQWF
jgi:hypothetical protein